MIQRRVISFSFFEKSYIIEYPEEIIIGIKKDIREENELR